MEACAVATPRSRPPPTSPTSSAPSTPPRGRSADYNVAPTKNIVAVVERHPRDAEGTPDPDSVERSLRVVRWGLVPYWAKDPKGGARMINARSESAAEKPAFRRALASRRCLIPADGWYEWQRGEDHKQPYYTHYADGRSLALAGLWEYWKPKDDPEGQYPDGLVTAAVLTAAAVGPAAAGPRPHAAGAARRGLGRLARPRRRRQGRRGGRAARAAVGGAGGEPGAAAGVAAGQQRAQQRPRPAPPRRRGAAPLQLDLLAWAEPCR